jgi:hypothetical protein
LFALLQFTPQNTKNTLHLLLFMCQLVTNSFSSLWVWQPFLYLKVLQFNPYTCGLSLLEKEIPQRKADPLSPMLVNIVVDILAIMIKRAKSWHLDWGCDSTSSGWWIIYPLACRWHSSLYGTQLRKRMESEFNFSNIWATFGYENNFHKIELFCIKEAQYTASQCADLFHYGQCQFLIRYLWIQINYRRLTIVEW